MSQPALHGPVHRKVFSSVSQTHHGFFDHMSEAAHKLAVISDDFLERAVAVSEGVHNAIDGIHRAIDGVELVLTGILIPNVQKHHMNNATPYDHHRGDTCKMGSIPPKSPEHISLNLAASVSPDTQDHALGCSFAYGCHPTRVGSHSAPGSATPDAFQSGSASTPPPTTSFKTVPGTFTRISANRITAVFLIDGIQNTLNVTVSPSIGPFMSHDATLSYISEDHLTSTRSYSGFINTNRFQIHLDNGVKMEGKLEVFDPTFSPCGIVGSGAWEQN